MIILRYPPGATPLDPSELEGLKLPHITTQGELNRWEQEYQRRDGLDATHAPRRHPDRGFSLYTAPENVWQGVAVGRHVSPVG